MLMKKFWTGKHGNFFKWHFSAPKFKLRPLRDLHKFWGVARYCERDLTHSWPTFLFFTSWKHKRNKDFLVFSGDENCWHWLEVDWIQISTSNHMFKREIWNEFTEFTFLKFWNLPIETREISKFEKINEVNFSEISQIHMWFLVNHMWQAVKEHTRIRITQKIINQYQQI